MQKNEKSTNNTIGEVLTTQEVAEYLKVPVHLLEQWRWSKTVNLPFFKLGRLVRYNKSDVDKFLQSKKEGE